MIHNLLIIISMTDLERFHEWFTGQQGLLEMQPGKPLMESFEVSHTNNYQ